MEILKKILRDKRFRLAAITGGILAVVAVIVAWKMGVTMAGLKQTWQDTESYLRSHPLAMFLALVFLPGLPIPMSALLVIAGVVWGANLQACLWMLLALALNMTWTYWLAAGPARRLIEKVLAHTSLKIPELPKNDHVRLILILRLTPGIPLFIHNYILGFFRTPFHLYLPLSMLLAGSIACGILLTGGALLSGQAGAAITGISLIVVGALVIKMLRARLAKSSVPASHPGLSDPPASLEEPTKPAPDPAAEI